MKNLLVYAPSPDFVGEPSFRIRLLNLAGALERRGFHLDMQARPKSPWGRLALARSARRCDGVILHRKMLDPYEAGALRRNLARGGRIFMDIDDATMLHETNLGTLARRRLERRFAATVKILDGVGAGNTYLAGMFEERGIRTTNIPSVVDPAAYPIKRISAGEAITLVWIGSRSTLKYLEESFPALQAAAARVPQLRLVTICDVAPAAPPVPLEHVPWSLAGEAAALLKGDIGIAPTPENPWTLGKCGFKIVQYMAAGLPVIASPVGVNAALVAPPGKAEAGILPATWAQWPEAIERLARDGALREQLGAAGRRQVEEELCVEKMAERWAQILTA